MAKYQYEGGNSIELLGKVYECRQLPDPEGRNDPGFLAWAAREGLPRKSLPVPGKPASLIVLTKSGNRRKADPGDWILKSPEGNFCVNADDTFRDTFRPYPDPEKEGA